MGSPNAFSQFRNALADLYLDKADCRRVCADAGLSTQYIDFDGPIINIWDSACLQAHKQDRLGKLVEVAQGQFGDVPSIQRLQSLAVEAQAQPLPGSPPGPIAVQAGATSGSAQRRTLDNDDRRQLVDIVAGRIEFQEGVRSRRVFLQMAGIDHLLPDFNFEGGARLVAGDLVTRLAPLPPLRDKPDFYPLGKLIDHLLRLPDLAEGQGQICARLVVCYRLVRSDDYLERLRSEYRLGDESTSGASQAQCSTPPGHASLPTEPAPVLSSPPDIPESDGAFDVFFSHSRADENVIELLARRVLVEQIKPWFGRWYLVPGEPRQEAIEDALERCSSVAVFVGPSGIGPWQNEEMRVAIERRVESYRAGGAPFRVIPVLLPQGQEPERTRLPSFLRRATWIDFKNGLDDESALRSLIAGIHGRAPGPAA